MNRDFVNYKRQALMEKHNLTIGEYEELIAVNIKLCKGIANRDLQSVQFTDREWDVLQVCISVVTAEATAYNRAKTGE